MFSGLRRVFLALVTIVVLGAGARLSAADKPEIIPLSEIHPGMKGIAYTIFSGDEIEPMDLEVLGVLPNALGPKQDIILIELKGPKVEHTGVVSGMSGSPVYINGKLAGAISLKLGIFNKEAIGGVTPIENMLEVAKAGGGNQHAAASRQVSLPAEFAQQMGLGGGNFLTPIETPLISSGFYPQTLARYASDLAAFGLTVSEGGTAAPRPDDPQIKPGSMVGMVLVRGDMSLAAGCTVTAIVGDEVFVCGHPLFGFGAVQFPLARAHVVTTLASSLASSKILTTGGEIGTVSQDRLTAVMGRLGPAPPMIPLEISIQTPAEHKQFRFEMIQDAKLTPIIVGLATLNGIVANTAYGEGATLQLTGKIEIEGHSPVILENMFAPTDIPIPDGFLISSAVQNRFARIFTNPYEQPRIKKISLQINSLPEKRWAAIDSAWGDQSEVRAGDTLRVKVLLRPYRGEPYIREVPITIPAQAQRGNLRVLVSDSDTLNRMNRFLALGSPAQLNGLEELIQLLNKERQNDRLYVTLLQPTPTLLVEDKELPNVPLSEINILDHRRNVGGSLLLGESVAGEWSVEMNQVIAGQQYLTITVK